MIETGVVGRSYCPSCEPEADPLGPEVLTVRFCADHQPVTAGDQDSALAPTIASGTSGDEAEGDTCRRFAAWLAGR